MTIHRDALDPNFQGALICLNLFNLDITVQDPQMAPPDMFKLVHYVELASGRPASYWSAFLYAKVSLWNVDCT